MEVIEKEMKRKHLQVHKMKNELAETDEIQLRNYIKWRIDSNVHQTFHLTQKILVKM